jgi:hypothetical protein
MRSRKVDVRGALGEGMGAMILAERIIALDDPALTHKILRRLAKVTRLVRTLRRSVRDPGLRMWLEQLVMKDVKRELEATMPDEIALRLYAHLRRVTRPRST